jgi:hypothetical protein
MANTPQRPTQPHQPAHPPGKEGERNPAQQHPPGQHDPAQRQHDPAHDPAQQPHPPGKDKDEERADSARQGERDRELRQGAADPNAPIAARDPYEYRIASRDDGRGPMPGDHDFPLLVDEQRQRSAEMERIGVAQWMIEHDPTIHQDEPGGVVRGISNQKEREELEKANAEGSRDRDEQAKVRRETTKARTEQANQARRELDREHHP